jgi:hypothetical protein
MQRKMSTPTRPGRRTHAGIRARLSQAGRPATLPDRPTGFTTLQVEPVD